MPVYKCKDGKWKIGTRGECKYETKEAAEAAWYGYINDRINKLKEFLRKKL